MPDHERDNLLEIVRAFVETWSEALDQYFDLEEDETYWHAGHNTWDALREVVMGDIAKQDKPFELDGFEFAVFVSLWEKWKELNPDRLQEPRIRALNERITKHLDGICRSGIV